MENQQKFIRYKSLGEIFREFLFFNELLGKSVSTKLLKKQCEVLTTWCVKVDKLLHVSRECELSVGRYLGEDYQIDEPGITADIYQIKSLEYLIASVVLEGKQAEWKRVKSNV